MFLSMNSEKTNDIHTNNEEEYRNYKDLDSYSKIEKLRILLCIMRIGGVEKKIHIGNTWCETMKIKANNHLQMEDRAWTKRDSIETSSVSWPDIDLLWPPKLSPDYYSLPHRLNTYVEHSLPHLVEHGFYKIFNTPFERSCV